MGTVVSALRTVVDHWESAKLTDVKVLCKLQSTLKPEVIYKPAGYISQKDNCCYGFRYQKSRWLYMDR